ncbi:hypothetical protein PIB30_089030, partial [Stylosanthes scabra]|nr:hypothetical protein [Stylosanthes scabra]
DLRKECAAECIGGFIAGICANTPAQSELCGVLHGLRMASQLGMRRVEVEVDSKKIKKVIEKLNPQNKYHNLILREIILFKQRPWELIYRITRREGNNTCAD